MTVQTGLGIVGTLVGDADLVDGIIVDLLRLLWLQQLVGCQRIERQSHEDSVEPYLIGIDRLVPVDLIGNGTRLVLQLLHHCLDGEQVLLLWIALIHTSHEMSCTDIVEVIVQQIVASDITPFVDHRIGILLTVLADSLSTISNIGVEHRLQFDTHHITPFGFCGKVEHETLGHTFHL